MSTRSRSSSSSSCIVLERSRSYCSSTVPQLEMLVEFMEAHKDIARGKTRTKEARASTKRLYAHLTPKLNRIGPKRTQKGWVKHWNDLKTKVRGKLADRGGHTELTALEKRVADIIFVKNDSIQDVNFEDISQRAVNKKEAEPSELDVNDPLPLLDSDYTDSRYNVTVEDGRDADSYDGEGNISSPETDGYCSDSTETKPIPEKHHDHCKDTLKKRNHTDCTKDIPEKKRKYRNSHENTTDKKRKGFNGDEDATDIKRECRDCVEDTTDKKRNCPDCVEGDKRNDYFGRLIAEEIKLVPSCMRNTAYRHCLKLVDALKKKHINEDVVEVIFKTK